MDSPIWIEGLPEQSEPGSGQATRSGAVWIMDASLGLIQSVYTSGWSPYDKKSYSALLDGIDIKPDNDYQAVRQQVLHALQALLKQDDGKDYYHPGTLRGFQEPPTSFHVQANHEEVLINGHWIKGLVEDGGRLVTITMPNGLSKTVGDRANNQFRIECRWVASNEIHPTSMSGIRLGWLTRHSQQEYKSPGSWTHKMFNVTDFEWSGSCELGRKLIDNYWTQGDPEKARSIINDNLNRVLGVRSA